MKVNNIHHVAYRCNCAKETSEWYKRYMNMDLTVAISEAKCPSNGQLDPYMHIFLEAGPNNILAFFELPNAPKMEVPICGKATPAWVQHIAFEVDDVPTLLRWKMNLKLDGIDVLGPTKHGIIESIYFFDPNGHRLELTCSTAEEGDMESLKAMAPAMVNKFQQTKSVVRDAEWLHKASSNPCGLLGVAFAMFADGSTDGRSLEKIFKDFGFSRTMKHRNLNIDTWTQGDINILIDYESNSFCQDFTKAHGPCLHAMGWIFENANAGFQTAVTRGATPVEKGIGAFEVPAIYGIGGSIIYFLEENGDLSLQAFMEPHSKPFKQPGKDLVNIDHFTNNVYKGGLQKWACFYMGVFGFEEYRYFNIRGKSTGLISYALRSPSGNFCIPINEGTEAKSQIVQYLNQYNGEGVQHIAFSSCSLVETLVNMKDSDVEFLDIDDEYYDQIFDKVKVTEDEELIKELRILVDNDGNDEGGYLLQIFSQEIIGPIFIELIQRKNHNGFGEGNFGALFRSMEKEHEKQGLL